LFVCLFVCLLASACYYSGVVQVRASATNNSEVVVIADKSQKSVLNRIHSLISDILAAHISFICFVFLSFIAVAPIP
jgi:uncharacterized membrane protein